MHTVMQAYVGAMRIGMTSLQQGTEDIEKSKLKESILLNMHFKVS